VTQASLFALLPQEAPKAAPELDLRPYQSAARKAVLEAHRSLRGALVVLPTGTGKTRTAGAVIWDYKVAGQKTLVLCPTITLVVQMYNDLRKLGLRPTIEQASNKADRYMADVVVASVATMKGDRLRSWPRDAFGLVIADEAHRSISGMYSEIFGWFEPAKLLGLTATPIRADGVSLGNVFDTTAYQMAMLTAIRDGWLVPLKFKTAITDFDPKALRTLAGEVDASSVAAEITRSGLLHEAANTLAELADGERAVAFLPTVASSKAFVGELLARGVRAEHVDGTTPEDLRNEMFARFASGETRALSNVAVLTEGWDCLDSESEILTANGWRGVGCVNEGDIVFAMNRETLAMEQVPVLEYVERPVNPGERMFSIVSQHVNVRTTEGHEFHIKYRDPKKRGALCDRFITRTGAQMASRRSAYALPISAELPGLPGVPLSDDELRLIAWFMTDGGFERSQFCISQSKEHHRSIRALLTRLGIEFSERLRTFRGGYPNAKPCYVFRIPKRAWSKYSDYLSKEVAPALHSMTREQFSVFWQELLLGDGCSSGFLCCDRKSQADAYTQMAVIRGFAASYTERTAASGRPYYMVTTRAAKWLTSDPSDARAAKVSLSDPAPGERVWCVRNRLSTLVVRRAGKISIIGNCPAASVIALLSPTKSWARLTQMIGRGTRLAPGKTHALVIDFCPGRMKRGRLASPADALAGRMLDDKVYDQLSKEGDLAESIEQAEKTVEELEERKRKSEKAAREKAERVKELAELARKRGFTYSVHEHDAESLLGGVGGWDRGYVANDVEGPSEEERRKALKLCSPRQAAILRKAGLNPDLKWWIAKEALDAYFANDKRFPQDILDNKRYQRKDKMQPADVASMADQLLEQLRGKR